MNKLQAMRVFARVAELGSFARVAEELGASASAITRHVGTLEAHLNARLLNRNTRTVSLTEIGKDYLKSCRDIIDRVDELELTLREATGEVSGTLRVAASLSFIASGLAQLLAGYKVLHPRIHFEVTAFDTRLDFAKGGFDVCFSEECQLASSTLISRRLVVVDDVLVASPTYLAQRGIPTTPDALDEHSLLAITNANARAWEFADATCTYRVETGHGMTTTNSLVVREAALNHMGIALLPSGLVDADITHGSLVRVLEQFRVNRGSHDVCLLYAGRTNLPRKVRAFIEYAVTRYRTLQSAAVLRAVA